jgi:hypothetical protein
VYGTWVANGKDAYDETKYNAKGHLEWEVSAVAGKVQFTHSMPTLSFVPDNMSDIPLVEMGMRCKKGVSADIVSEETTNQPTEVDIVGSACYTNLDKTTQGLDRFFKTISPASATVMGTNNNNLVDAKNVCTLVHLAMWLGLTVLELGVQVLVIRAKPCRGSGFRL